MVVKSEEAHATREELGDQQVTNVPPALLPVTVQGG